MSNNNNKGKKELVVKETSGAVVFSQVENMATTLFKSGLFTHLKNPVQAVAIAQYGNELGIPPMQSLQMMCVISGKICMQSQLMLSLVKQKGCDVEIVEQTEEKCKINFVREEKKYPVEFSKKEATLLGLIGRDNYKKQSANMFFWRAVSKAIRYYAPDLLMGAYSIEEFTEGKATTVSEVPDEPIEIADSKLIEKLREKAKMTKDQEKIYLTEEEIEKGLTQKRAEILIEHLQKYIKSDKETEETKPELYPVTQKQKVLTGKLLLTHTLTLEEKKNWKITLKGITDKSVMTTTIEALMKQIEMRKEIEKEIGKGKLPSGTLSFFQGRDKGSRDEILGRLNEDFWAMSETEQIELLKNLVIE